MDKPNVNALQESWEEVQSALHKLIEAGNRFELAAQAVEGGSDTASRFDQHLLRHVKDFAYSAGVRVSEESIGEEVEDIVINALRG